MRTSLQGVNSSVQRQFPRSYAFMPELRPRGSRSHDGRGKLSYPRVEDVSPVSLAFSVLRRLSPTLCSSSNPSHRKFGWHREASSAGSALLHSRWLRPARLGFCWTAISRAELSCHAFGVLGRLCFARIADAHLLHFYFTFFVIGLVGNGTGLH